MKITLSGVPEIKAALIKMDADAKRAAEQVVEITARSIERKVKTGLSRGGRSGRTYQRRGITHQASAAGEYPKTDTGALVASVFTDISGLFATVGSNLVYSAHLEYGTRNMSARPMWGPIREEETLLFWKRMESAMKGATR